jgi:hypothetical protein
VEQEPRSGKHCMSKTEESVTKVTALVRSARLWTVTVVGSELNLDHQQTVHDILTEDLDMRTLGRCITTTLPVTLPRPWTKFWPKRVFQWFRSPIFALSESVWLLPFPETLISPQRSNFGTVDNMQMVVTEQLRALSHEDFQHCSREWERLRRFVASQGS